MGPASDILHDQFGTAVGQAQASACRFWDSVWQATSYTRSRSPQYPRTPEPVWARTIEQLETRLAAVERELARLRYVTHNWASWESWLRKIYRWAWNVALAVGKFPWFQHEEDGNETTGP